MGLVTRGLRQLREKWKFIYKKCKAEQVTVEQMKGVDASQTVIIRYKTFGSHRTMTFLFKKMRKKI